MKETELKNCIEYCITTFDTKEATQRIYDYIEQEISLQKQMKDIEWMQGNLKSKFYK